MELDGYALEALRFMQVFLFDLGMIDGDSLLLSMKVEECALDEFCEQICFFSQQ